jgi:hypothetical protein
VRFVTGEPSSESVTTLLAMASEIIAGKRVLIAREGHKDFELPEGHELRVERDDDGNVIAAGLRFGDHRSAFLATTEEREHDVVVRLGRLVGSSDYGGQGDALRQFLPYPFADG